IPSEADAETEDFLTPGEESSTQMFRACRMAIDYIGPAGSFAGRTASAARLLVGRAQTREIHGKDVLIGATAAAMGDRVASPFASASSATAPGVEVLANAITTILRSRFYLETPDWVAATLAALLAAVVIGALTLAQGKREFIKQ